MKMRWAWVLLACSLGTNARAASEDREQVERARKYFEAGKQAYDAGIFKGAATAFEEAYNLSPRPQIAFSLAQAYRRQYFVDRDPLSLKKAVELLKAYIEKVQQGGRRADALQFLTELEPLYKRAEDDLRRASMVTMTKKPDPTQIMVSSRTMNAVAAIDGGDASEVPLLREVSSGKHKIHLEAPGYFAEDVEELAVDNRLVVVELSLREKPARISLTAPEGADIQVNGRPFGTTPLSRPIEVSPGNSFLAVTTRGAYPFTRELRLAHDQSISLDVDLETTTQRKMSYGVLATGGATIIAGVVTTVLALIAQKNASDLDASIHQRVMHGMNSLTSDLNDFNADVHRRDRLVSGSEVLYAVGAGISVAGALLFFVDNPRVDEPAIMVQPMTEPKESSPPPSPSDASPTMSLDSTKAGSDRTRS
jgi:hypothetical protein